VEICEGCKQEIDLTVCQCGSSPGQCDNHTFVPMGCNCHNLTIQQIMENMRPDPGEGYYLVKPYTMLQDGDELWIKGKWLRLAPPEIVIQSWAPLGSYVRRKNARNPT
jgi:hypothetical protein